MFKKKSLALIVSLGLILTVSVGSTLAFLIAQTGPVVNIFNPSKVTTSVDETFENNVKTNVSIKNTGDTEAYIRAAVVVTWQDEDGNVYGEKPTEGTDYTISFNTDQQTDPEGKWTLAGDGFYYWSNPVAGYTLTEGGEKVYSNTGILLTECKPLEAAPADGYFLCVEIIGSGIQSVPASVVASEWSNEKVTISVGNNGILNVTNNA